MATITSLGVGSGLDLENLVTSLMQVERRPLTSLQNQVKSFNTKISALGTLSSKLSTLQTAAKGLVPSPVETALNKFSTFSAAVGDTSIASARASTGAVAGEYTLAVNQLAQGQRIASAAFAGGTDSTIATGTLTVDFGSVDGGSFTADPLRQATINIDSTNNTLGGLRNAINQANIGLSATIVNGTSGAQLVITGQDGGNQAFSLNGLTGFAFNPADPPASTDFVSNRPALNAEFSLNGIPATSSSNTVTDVLDGVTLTLTKKNATGESTTLSITRDDSTKLKEGIDAFIKAYNDAAATIKSQGAYNTETKVAGALQGNSLLRTTESSLRNLVFSATTGSGDYQRLSDLGIGFAADGTLKVNKPEKLDAAIASNASGVANLVAEVGRSFDQGIERVIGISGSIKISTDSMNTSIRDLNKRQDAIETRLTSIEARYRKQFSALDTLMSNMSKTSSYLAQQLANLPTISG